MWKRPIVARAAFFALVLSLLAVGDALAQDNPQQPPRGMHGQVMMMGPMEGPQMALREREQLELSEDQVRQLESIQERLQDQHAGAMEEIQNLHGEIEAATEEDFDEAAARTALQQIADMHVEIGVSMLEARHETRELLTEEQRQQLSEVMQERMRRMMDDGMMPGMGGPGRGAGPGGSH